MSNKFIVIAAFLAFFAGPAQAEAPAATEKGAAPQFLFPVSCSLGEDCWTVNYDDSDAATGSAKDFRCGPRTYDGHDGTDFAIRDWVTMAGGVDVLAAAEGKIVRVRDEMDDLAPSAADLEKLRADKKGCGNGVLIDHGGGWQTIYCHMKKGSVVVKPDQKVATGQNIGQVGQSGLAEFPHLHFGVIHDGKMIDPFTGGEATAACSATAQGAPMWLEGLNVDYEPVTIYAAGFEPGEPDFEKIKNRAEGAPTVPHVLPVLTFWVSFYGVQEGDNIAITIADPNGDPFASRDIVQDKTRARQFYFVGKKIPHSLLFPGTYTGKAVITRRAADGGTITRDVVKTIKVGP
ncbi:MAG TPA: M23 family metallopeptidase [Alphaproteobacteria bacterium]